MNCRALQPTKLKQFRKSLRSALVLAPCMIVACFFLVARANGADAATVRATPTADRNEDPNVALIISWTRRVLVNFFSAGRYTLGMDT